MRCVLGPGKGEVAACDVEEVAIPPHVYTGPGEQLFDFLARALSTFIDKHQVRGWGREEKRVKGLRLELESNAAKCRDHGTAGPRVGLECWGTDTSRR